MIGKQLQPYFKIKIEGFVFVELKHSSLLGDNDNKDDKILKRISGTYTPPVGTSKLELIRMPVNLGPSKIWNQEAHTP